MATSTDDDPNVLDIIGLCGTRPSAVLVREIRLCDGLADGWRPGPTPFLQPTSDSAKQRGHRRTTDADARRSLIAPQQGRVLYGAVEPLCPEGGRPASTRRHQLTVGWTCAGIIVVAVEVLLLDSSVVSPRRGLASGLLAVHVDAGNEPVDATDRRTAALSDVLQPTSPRGELFWRDLADLLGSSISAVGSVRGMYFDQIEKSGSARSEALALAYLRVAGAAKIDAPLRERAERHELTIERPDWSALVLRDGAAFVAHQTGGEQFSPTLRMLVHTVYLDGLLLALTQRRLLDDSDQRATAADLDTPADLVSLESQHFDFKRTYWRTSLTQKRRSPTDDVLRAFQNELLTPLDVTDVEDRVREGARLARTLHAERAEHAQDQLTRLIRNATIVIGSFSLAFTAAPVLAGPSFGAFLWAAFIAVTGIAVAFTFLHLANTRGTH